MMDMLKVLEHLAVNTGKPVDVICRDVNVIYWKDEIDFSRQNGHELFASYLRSMGISRLEDMCGGYGVELPLSIYHKADPDQKVRAYISADYAEAFKREHKEVFEFPD